MKKLEFISQLNVGTRIKIIAYSEKYSQITSVKKLIIMQDFDTREICDVEIITNRRKNHYFSFNNYINDESKWAKKVYILDGKDKRLKRELRK